VEPKQRHPAQVSGRGIFMRLAASPALIMELNNRLANAPKPGEHDCIDLQALIKIVDPSLTRSQSLDSSVLKAP
jgi:hypothetical protein